VTTNVNTRSNNRNGRDGDRFFTVSHVQRPFDGANLGIGVETIR